MSADCRLHDGVFLNAEGQFAQYGENQPQRLRHLETGAIIGLKGARWMKLDRGNHDAVGSTAHGTGFVAVAQPCRAQNAS
jgi:hypothetical protein